VCIKCGLLTIKEERERDLNCGQQTEKNLKEKKYHEKEIITAKS
jgi:hypothetical protein